MRERVSEEGRLDVLGGTEVGFRVVVYVTCETPVHGWPCWGGGGGTDRPKDGGLLLLLLLLLR